MRRDHTKLERCQLLLGPFHVLVGMALLLSGCVTSTAPTTSSAEPDPTTTSAAVTTSTAPATTVAPITTVAEVTLPGEPVDFGPMEGDRLMVIGVSHDAFLNLRELPGTSFEAVAEIPPDYEELVALGNTRDLGHSFWVEVDYQGTTGWAHMGFVGLEGVTDDVTAYVIGQLGERPTAESMSGLGLMISDLFASIEPASEVVMVTPETIGDVAEVTFDIIGLGDDSVRGLRVRVFAEPFEGGFTLRTVEVTNICGRGVTDSGLCT